MKLKLILKIGIYSTTIVYNADPTMSKYTFSIQTIY